MDRRDFLKTLGLNAFDCLNNRREIISEHDEHKVDGIIGEKGYEKSGENSNYHCMSEFVLE